MSGDDDGPTTTSTNNKNNGERTKKAMKQLLCGGVAGATAKTVTAPFSRLTILYQVHSMVTTKKHHPKFALSLDGGFRKIVERGGLLAMWRGNGTSVLHRFPYSAINFYVYENMLRLLNEDYDANNNNNYYDDDDQTETGAQLVRRVTNSTTTTTTLIPSSSSTGRSKQVDTSATTKFMAGATAGSAAVIACYPLDLVRTRLTTELEGREHYRGMVDAFRKIATSEGLAGFYCGLGPTLLVAVPNFAISYRVYGTLKEQILDDELFYNLRRVDSERDEPKSLGFQLTLLCGAASGTLATLATFPMDTIRRRMQIQSLHMPVEERLTARRHIYNMVTREGFWSLYRGLTPELLKVIPMVGTMFFVYESAKDFLGV
jgi:hypothetical protein